MRLVRRNEIPIRQRITELPDDFIEIVDCLPSQIDRQLGYFGQSRFVTFRYEPRAQDVMWTDDRSAGIGTGGWETFCREIESLAGLYDVQLGDDKRPAEHVLVYDRITLNGYFATRATADEFLSRRRQLSVA